MNFLATLQRERDDLVRSYAPFHLGETVQLNSEIDFAQAWGWHHAKDWLVMGARGRVTNVRFENGKFIYSVKFADDQLAFSGFSEDQLKKVPSADDKDGLVGFEGKCIC